MSMSGHGPWFYSSVHTRVLGSLLFKVKVSSYIAQIAQSVLRFTSLADLFNQITSQIILEASNHMLQLMRERCSYTYLPFVYSQVLIYTAE